MNSQPLVNVVINCFNGEKFIKESIESVINQSYNNWEIIFWDNGSSDQTKNIVENYQKSSTKIKYFHYKENEKLGIARNKAINECTGKYITFLDVDDIWLPKKLERQMLGLISSNHILSYCGITEVDQDLNTIRNLPPRWVSGEQLSSQLRYFEINLVTAVVNRRKLYELGIDFDERMEASEEYNLFLRLLPYGTVFVCHEVLALYRVYQESLTYKKMERWSIERRITLVELAANVPYLAESEPYKAALQQADYYEACFLMSQRSHARARHLLIKYKTQKVFRILAYVTYIPWLWKILHNPFFKKRLTSIFSIL